MDILAELNRKPKTVAGIPVGVSPTKVVSLGVSVPWKFVNVVKSVPVDQGHTLPTRWKF